MCVAPFAQFTFRAVGDTGRLLPHKKALEIHLKNWLGEGVQLESDLPQYDMTSTYFEGGSGFPGGAARLLARSAQRLQTGVHRTCGFPMRNAAC